MIKVVTVVPCKNRIEDLKANLPHFIDQDVGPHIEHSVYVVDYDCQEGTFEYCLTQPVECIKVHDRPYYKYSKARNIGMRRAIEIKQADYVIITDVDLHVFPWLVRRMVGQLIYDNADLLKTQYPLRGAQNDLGNLSLSCIRSDVLMKLRGYDESHEGYGHDDTNFYWRAERQGFKFSNLKFYDLCNFHNASGNKRFLEPGPTTDENFIWATTERDTNPNGWGNG